jgi:hypothetical protein
MQSLPVYHNDGLVSPGTEVTGGTLTYADGSVVQLSDTTTAVVVQSFRADDGAPTHVIKQNAADSGTVVAGAPGGTIIDIANEAARTLIRGGVAGVEYTAGETPQVHVQTASGEVVVDGRVVERGQTQTSDDGTGSLSTEDGGVAGTGSWVSDPDNPATVAWSVSKQPGEPWHYEYHFTVNQYDISHIIIETASNFAASDLLNYVGTTEIGNFGPESGNPNMPCDIYGIKFDEVTGTDLWITFDSWRGPQWGNFYAKGGKAGKLGWNTLWNAWAQDTQNEIMVPGSVNSDPNDEFSSTTSGNNTIIGEKKQSLVSGGPSGRSLGKGTTVLPGRWIKATDYR